jgi:hypothetical protein
VTTFRPGRRSVTDRASMGSVRTTGVMASNLQREPTRPPSHRRSTQDFMFQLTSEEAQSLRSQTVTLEIGGPGLHRKYLPYVFTEHGAVMAASVLNSPRAVQMSLYVVRAFLKLREWVAGQGQLVVKLAELERHVAGHDQELKAIVQAIRQLMTPPDVPRRKIGFRGG